MSAPVLAPAASPPLPAEPGPDGVDPDTPSALRIGVAPVTSPSIVTLPASELDPVDVRTPPVPDVRVRTPVPDVRRERSGGPVVDVEFAHHCWPWSERGTEWEIEATSTVAGAIVASLRDTGLTVSTSVLIDDKKVGSPGGDDGSERVDWCLKKLNVDRVMWESRLVEHLDAVERSCAPGSAVPGRMRRRLARQHELACSQDVAIWQALRLGAFAAEVDTWAPSPDPGGDVGAADLVGPADIVVTVLPRRYEEYERKAYHESLRPWLEATPLAETRGRTTLRGRASGREVVLWAIFLDPEEELGDAALQELGTSEAEQLVHHLPQSTRCSLRPRRLTYMADG
jgi:hypothetical protein